MSDVLHNIEAFILAGGASRRMNRQAKALLDFNGRSLVARLADELRTAQRTRLVIHDDEYPTLDEKLNFKLERVADLYTLQSSLAGLHAALFYASSDWVLVVACDLPFVGKALFERLAWRREDNLAAIIPFDIGGKAQTLCALYRRDAALAIVEQMLAEDEKRVRVLIEKLLLSQNLKVRFVEFAELADLPNAEKLFVNLNTPEDLQGVNQSKNQEEKRSG